MNQGWPSARNNRMKDWRLLISEASDLCEVVAGYDSTMRAAGRFSPASPRANPRHTFGAIRSLDRVYLGEGEGNGDVPGATHGRTAVRGHGGADDRAGRYGAQFRRGRRTPHPATSVEQRPHHARGV